MGFVALLRCFCRITKVFLWSYKCYHILEVCYESNCYDEGQILQDYTYVMDVFFLPLCLNHLNAFSVNSSSNWHNYLARHLKVKVKLLLLPKTEYLTRYGYNWSLTKQSHVWKLSWVASWTYWIPNLYLIVDWFVIHEEKTVPVSKTKYSWIIFVVGLVLDKASVYELVLGNCINGVVSSYVGAKKWLRTMFSTWKLIGAYLVECREILSVGPSGPKLYGTLLCVMTW